MYVCMYVHMCIGYCENGLAKGLGLQTLTNGEHYKGENSSLRNIRVN